MNGLRPALLAALLLTAACDESPIAERAVPFTRDSLDGRPFALPGDGDGKVVILHFWASAPPGSGGQLAALEELWAARRTRGLALLAVDVGESRATAAAFIAGRALSYPVALDPASALARAYGVTDLPVTVLIDRQGLLRKRIPASIPFSVLRSALDTLL